GFRVGAAAMRARGATREWLWTTAATPGEAEAPIAPATKELPSARRAVSARTKCPFRCWNMWRVPGVALYTPATRKVNPVRPAFSAGREPAEPLSIISVRLAKPDPAPRRRKVGVVVPARNEADRIGLVLAGMARSVEGLPVVCMVVDDGSSDITAPVAHEDG